MDDPFATSGPDWTLTETRFDPKAESSIEARFAVSNGFLGVRASRAISRAAVWMSWLNAHAWTSWPRTYVAGLFDIPETDPPVPALVPVADWLRLRLSVNGEAVVLGAGETLSHTRTLDMGRGVMLTDWRQHVTNGPVVRARTLRLVSLADRATGLQVLHLTIDGRPADVRLEAAFEGAGDGMETDELSQDFGQWRTIRTRVPLAMAGAAALSVADRPLSAERPAPLVWRWSWRSAPDETVTMRRFMAVARGDDCGTRARAALTRATSAGWRAMIAAHEAAWSARWTASDIAISGDPAAREALRFATYHLIGAANPDDPTVSIGARALTGDTYLGHVFWDTEIYLLPFYTLTWPEAARALLLYRWHTLPGARAKAASRGWRGAMYAWESAGDGMETTPERVMGPEGKLVDVLSGKLEQHITADVAFAVWRFWRWTGDDAFMRDAGAEIILETARFWASRARIEADGRAHIRDVIGPDEYHEHIDDNAFTNVMARWTLRRGLDTAAWLRATAPALWTDLSHRLDLTDTELTLWTSIADTLVTGFDPDTGLFEQFEGYFGLEPINLADHADDPTPMDVRLGRARTQASQVIKQADVVALLALRPEAWPETVHRANFDYYAPRCTHGSSLSRAMHAISAARLGETDLALRFFNDSTTIDLSDDAAGAGGGVHIAGLGGLWQVAVFGFAGLSFTDDAIHLDPNPPASWESLTFRIQWRGRSIAFRIEPDAVHADLQTGADVTLVVRGEERILSLADTRLRACQVPG